MLMDRILICSIKRELTVMLQLKTLYKDCSQLCTAFQPIDGSKSSQPIDGCVFYTSEFVSLARTFLIPASCFTLARH